MNKKIFTLAYVLFATVSYSQAQTEATSLVQQKHVSENANYQLFQTKNYWTFIKLDTRNGKMWQVQFSVNDHKNTGEVALNSIPLVSEEKEVKGRFTLYPTENIYNFLLLDQIDGTVVQVQWSMEGNKRGIVSVIKPIDL